MATSVRRKNRSNPKRSVNLYYIGVDIGGSFTDLVVIDDAGKFSIYKAESTPGQLIKGVVECLNLAAKDLGLSVKELLQKVPYFAHGTTVATNSMIERKGARTGLITTKGFEDTIFIQRIMGLYAGLSIEKAIHFSQRSLPVPIVPRNLVKGVTERVDYSGTVIVPLNKGEVRNAVRELLAQKVETIAVCFLWSFRNPSHEQEVKKIILEEAPGLLNCISSELIPVLGDYERTATTVINAYLGPPIATYLGTLEKNLRDLGLKGNIHIMNSIGGAFDVKEAAERAVYLLSSGPAGGVLASLSLGAALENKNIITTDMGGTSFDVGLIADGNPIIASTSVVDKYHILVPMIDITSIGAGGGSVARVSDRGLRVGPESAGAVPGPVCYEKGGTEPTVTDADVVLGLIEPEFFLGGRKKLSKALAEAAIKGKIAEPLGMGIIEAAAGIRKVVDSQMADLLRTVTLGKGYDPRDFILFAYGGAGPTHCCGYIGDLGISKVIVPVMATVQSAYGAVASDIRFTFEISQPMKTPPYFDAASKYLDVERINSIFEMLETQGIGALRKDNIKEKDMIFRRTVAMRYRRQTHEIVVDVPNGKLAPLDVDKLANEFDKKYESVYGQGTAFREAGIEITLFRLDAIGQIKKPVLKTYQVGSQDPSKALLGEKEVYFYEAGGFVKTKLYDGTQIHAGNLLVGPSVVYYPGTTIVVGPDYKSSVDRYLNVVIERV